MFYHYIVGSFWGVLFRMPIFLHLRHEASLTRFFCFRSFFSCCFSPAIQSWYHVTEPQSHRATEPQSHRATEPQSHRAYSSLLLVIFSLLLAITLPSCANVKGLFTEDRNPPNGPPPDPDCLGEAEGDFQAGEGTEASPYLVCTYEQLKKIGEGLDKHYEQGNKINASPSWGEREGAGSCTAYNGSNADTADCAGWVPLGDNSSRDAASRFTGSFNGRGYVISKLYANVSPASGSTYASLFGYIDGGSVSNVGLTELRIESTSTSNNPYAGGLVGRNRLGTISNSYVVGSVEASSTTSSSYVGGLVGYNTGTISNSYATGSVKASSSSDNSYAGGLLGRNNSGTISNSYATGSVTASTTSSYAGGLVGWNETGTISNSYATGSVTAPSTAIVGGLAGLNRNLSGIGNTNYWDTDTTALAANCGDGTCTAVGLTNEKMQATSESPTNIPARLGPAFSLGDGYPKLYQCKIDPATNACVADSFLPEPVPGQ